MCIYNMYNNHSSRRYALVYQKEEGGYSGYWLELPGAISQTDIDKQLSGCTLNASNTISGII